MRVKYASPPDVMRFQSYLHSRYGIGKDDLQKWSWIRYKESVWIVSRDIQPIARSSANLFQLGLLAFMDATSFESTSHFITFLGNRIKQNVVLLSSEQADTFFARNKISREKVDTANVLSDGFVAISLSGKIIGSGRLTKSHLMPNLPPQYHGTEIE
ncbi:MAG: hypothetical protein V1776_05475 [Candidatus Diapherotrites archaeon]